MVNLFILKSVCPIYYRLIIVLLLFSAGFRVYANEPDSAYIFAYSTEKDHHHNGLHFAWSIDRSDWHAIGPEHSFLKCDYGRWGSQKKMLSPFLYQSKEGLWHCVWSLNDSDGALGHASSADLIYWGAQSYPILMPNGNCLKPAITCGGDGKAYSLYWTNTKSGKGEYYTSDTKDWRHFTVSKPSTNTASLKEEARINGKVETGTVHKVSWEVVNRLIDSYRLAEYKKQQWAERLAIDPSPWKDSIQVSFNIEAEKKKKISDLLIGIFFEDINYAADGGLYAELVQNRGFEYHPSDKEYQDKNWNNQKAWSLNMKGEGNWGIDTLHPIHNNNKQYAVLHINKTGLGIINEGFGGISLRAGEKYDVSVFACSPEKKRGRLLIRLIGKNGEIYGETSTAILGKDWKKLQSVITARQSIKDARIEVIPQQTGQVRLDMLSLFPQNTFKGRKNGLRADLAQTIADMKPRFVRFPGGCVAHGDGLHNIYRWENTIGPLESRKPQRNLWGYQQSMGLGYFEYFQFCEDLGAEPVPVVAAGVPCQNSAHHGCAIGGQQGGIPLEEMDEYIQSILNLIEYANGDPTSTWGRKRAEAGHPKPFNLKYIGVGNEDLITDIFAERFEMIYRTIQKKHPEITVIGTVGPFCEGTDYVEGWKLADRLRVPMVDEHYYQTPGWFLNNQDYYDKYDRSKAKVYLGEYAAHIPGRHNNIETALCEALHLIQVERNGDVVAMTSYAPLLAKEGHTQWNPDLIYFNNTEVTPTTGYFVQQLFGQNAGDEYVPHSFSCSTDHKEVKKRVSASFVIDTAGNELIIKLVNLLPVTAQSAIDLSGMISTDRLSTLTVLTGKPEDKTAKPTESSIQVGARFNYTLPSYSLSIIKIQMESKQKTGKQ